MQPPQEGADLGDMIRRQYDGGKFLDRTSLLDVLGVIHREMEGDERCGDGYTVGGVELPFDGHLGVGQRSKGHDGRGMTAIGSVRHAFCGVAPVRMALFAAWWVVGHLTS